MIDLFGLKSKKKIKELEQQISCYENDIALKATEVSEWKPITVRSAYRLSGEDARNSVNALKEYESGVYYEMIKKDLLRGLLNELERDGYVNFYEQKAARDVVMIAEIKVLKCAE